MKTGRQRIMTLDQALLSVIIVLQSLILVRMFSSGTALSLAVRESQPTSVIQPAAASAPAAVVRADPPGEATWVSFAPSRLPVDPTRPDAALRQAWAMQDQMDRMFRDAVDDWETMRRFIHNMDKDWDRVATMPAGDMRPRGNFYRVEFSLPGFSISDISVTLNDRHLHVFANPPMGVQSSRISGPVGAVLEVRRRRFRFERQVQLPGPVGDYELASVTFTNGILTVSVPRTDRDNLSPQRGTVRLL